MRYIALLMLLSLNGCYVYVFGGGDCERMTTSMPLDRFGDEVRDKYRIKEVELVCKRREFNTYRKEVEFP